MLRGVSGTGRFDPLLDAAREQLSRFVVPDPEPVALLFLDVPGAPAAAEDGSPQRRALEAFDGAAVLTDGTAFLGWLPDPAVAIGVWLRLGETYPESGGGLAQGFAHAYELVRATVEEAAALASLAGPRELMVPFELTNQVDLRDPRFSVENQDKGALVPATVRLRMRRVSRAEIRNLDPARDAEACDAIIQGLPDYFGIPEANAECARAVREEPGAVAELGGEVVGFLTWETAGPSAEITWMAVRSDERGRGHGRALITALVELLRDQGVKELSVKTLSSRHQDPGYADTRAFYAALGFTPQRELDVWGPDNPAVLMTRRL
jgi:GNAT superfamily N-acetyltransferase